MTYFCFLERAFSIHFVFWKEHFSTHFAFWKEHFLYFCRQNINCNIVMEKLFELFYDKLKRVDTIFERYLMKQIDWEEQLIGITGARGVGKTTLMLQHIKKTFGGMPRNVLYVSLDNLWFSENKLFDLAHEFSQQGGEILFLDEVHKYENWSQEIKNIYDSFPDMKMVFTGSSILEIHRGKADLSRRAIHYFLHGLSFREYIALEHRIDLPVCDFTALLENHLQYLEDIHAKIKPIPVFQDYLKFGYFPYSTKKTTSYYSKLEETINLILEVDLPTVENIEINSVRKIKKLLTIIARMVPFTPKITELAAAIEVTRNSLLKFLFLLERANLLNLLDSNVNSLNSLAKPEKIYLNNTNLIYALAQEKPNIGNVRETFFYNQVSAFHKVTHSNRTDFCVDAQYFFEVGGKNKGHEQIVGLQNAYLVLDNIEYGHHNVIPLWMFGLLY
jgi:predicted AAA+ superfamily ATPase